MTESIVMQALLPKLPEQIRCRRYDYQSAGKIAQYLTNVKADILGIDITQSSDGTIDCLALATLNIVLIITKDLNSTQRLQPEDKHFQDILNGQSGICLAAFRMEKLAVHLFRDLNVPVRGVDLSTLGSKSTMSPLRPSKLIADRLFSDIDEPQVDRLFAAPNDVRNISKVCLRAWISAHVANSFLKQIASASKVDTRNLERNQLLCLSDLMIQSDKLEDLKPQETPNEFDSLIETKDGNLDLRNARYSNRVRNNTTIVLTNSDGKEYIGRAAGVKGKTTTIKLKTGHFRGKLYSVVATGKQEPTNSERARNEFILLALQGKQSLSSRFIRILWFPTPNDVQHLRIQNLPQPPSIVELNLSQREVVSAMISNTPEVVVVHGPPGTGKTRTISEAAKIWDEHHSPTWIVANSNVAVKNIAESLFKKGVNFKLLVSKEFYEEWHEHIYAEIEEMLLRTDEFPEDIHGLEMMMGDSCIVLSTLSMLSNPVLEEIGAFKLVKLTRLIVDEASQINVFDFLHLFGKFAQLQKVCFFGDPKQLPPYGQTDVPSLQSVFDIPHLRDAAYFLNIQYRMPTQLGEFISREVYDSKLQSEHRIKIMSCVSFVDVSKGEEVNAGYSWKNFAEAETIVHLVRHYYQARDFCVITPYDAQRSEIEKHLKAEGLPWKSVFNVDSFQGNEAQFVIVSVVRTSKPGFLDSFNRMNVMLTRCKTGMIIVTNRAFLLSNGKHTLLGMLSRYWQTEYGMSKTWVAWQAVAEGKAILPSEPTTESSSPPSPHTAKSSILEPVVEPAVVKPLVDKTSWRFRGHVQTSSVQSPMDFGSSRLARLNPPSPRAEDIGSQSPRISKSSERSSMTPWRASICPAVAQSQSNQHQQIVPASDSFPSFFARNSPRQISDISNVSSGVISPSISRISTWSESTKPKSAISKPDVQSSFLDRSGRSEAVNWRVKGK